MNRDCGQWQDLIQQSEDPGADPVLLAHVRQCPFCAEQMRRWEEISGAAHSLRKEWHSPNLWPRIDHALTAESLGGATDGPARWWRIGNIPAWSLRALAVAAVVLCVGLPVFWLASRGFHHSPVAPHDADAGRRLLTEQALAEVEASEAAYIQSIEKLSRLVQSDLEGAGSPLMLNYREKIILIDSAIGDCRANIEQNRFNAHLRSELLSIYRDKERTLEDLIREKKNEQQ